MKAILLAAGTGSRLAPLTLEKPKCLVELDGKPLLQYQLAALKSVGIEDIVVVAGHMEHTLKGYPVKIVSNPHFATTNMVYSLFCAKDFMDDDVLISYTDIVYEPSILKNLVEDTAEFAVSIDLGWRSLWSVRMDDPLSDAERLTIDNEGYILEIGGRPRDIADIQGQYMGLIKISREILRKFYDLYSCLDQTATYEGRSYKQMFMTTLIQIAINNNFKVRAVSGHHGWLEVDSLADLDAYKKLLNRPQRLFNYILPMI